MPEPTPADKERFTAAHPPFPGALDTVPLLDEMQRRMEEAGVASFSATIDSAKQELATMPDARARALGPRFWARRLVLTANRALRAAGKPERWTEVKLEGGADGPDPVWLLLAPDDGRSLEALGLGRRMRPVLRFVSYPFALLAVGLGVVAFREQTTGAIVLALAGYVVWFVSTQVAMRLSGRRTWRSL